MNAGEVIQNRYELEDRLGRGGMGEVWRARDVRLERTVALKVISPALAEQPEFLVRFLREAQSIARINHPNVVNILDFGETGGLPFLVMEYVPGQSLADMTGTPVDQDRAREVVAQAAAGAGAAHAQDIVHRDIKPGNILLTDDGRAKLVDFGIAAGAGQERLTMTGTTIGSPHYISPEQASGDRATPASDVYALGIVMYELLTSRRPFEADNVASIAAAHVNQPPAPLSAHVSGIDPGLEAVVMRSLAKDPAQRYSNGTALAEALRETSAAGTAVMAGAAAAAVAGDTAVLQTDDFDWDEPPPPSKDSVGKAILMGLAIGLVVLAVFIGVMLLVRSLDDDATDNSGSGGGPGPAETTGEPAPETEEPAVEPAPDEDTPAEEEPPPDDGSPPGQGLLPESPPGEGEEDDDGVDPPPGEEVSPGGGGGGGGGGG